MIDHANVSPSHAAVASDNCYGPGVTDTLGAEAGEVPAAFSAVTVNVYAVPLVNPPTVTVVAPVVVTNAPPGLAVTWYPVIGEPPSLTGADHDTTAAS
jgi:hypothetical protein